MLSLSEKKPQGIKQLAITWDFSQIVLEVCVLDGTVCAEWREGKGG